MPRRSLVRKLGAPAIAALRRASSSPRVSPAAVGSGRPGLRSSQATLEFKKNWNEEKERNYHQEVSRLIDNLPRTIALSFAASALVGASIAAYVVGAFE